MKIFKRCIVIFLLAMFIIGCAKSNILTAGKINNVEEGLKIHAEEKGYNAFVEYMESGMTEEEYEVLKEALDDNYINQGMKTLKYSSVSGNKDYCYMNGTYTIPYHVRLVVKWAENIDIDAYNENFNCNRHFSVLDPSKDAYMLIGDMDDEYQIVRIVPDSSDETTLDVEYTQEGFDYLCGFLENRKQYLLATLLTDQIITEELINNLQSNRQEYEYVFEYAKHLPTSSKEAIQKQIEAGTIGGGIEVIPTNEPFVDKCYIYENGEYTIHPDSNCSRKWSQNFEEIIDEESQEVKFKIIDRTEDAYMLLWKESGFVLVCFRVV